jgi:hypothetical protein
MPSPRYKCDADSSPFTLFPPISKPVRPTAEPEKYDDVRDVLLNVRAAFPYNVPSPLEINTLPAESPAILVTAGGVIAPASVLMLLADSTLENVFCPLIVWLL